MSASIPNWAPNKADRPHGVTGRLPQYFAAFILSVAFASATTGENYSFRATVDRDSLTVGDPVHLTLTLDYPEGTAPEFIPDLELPDALRTLAAPDAVDRAKNEGMRRRVQTIRLAAFRPGEGSIDRRAGCVVRSPGDTVRLSDSPISLLVLSVRPDSLTDILDVKGPVSINPEIPIWVWVSLGLLAVAIVLLVLWLRRNRYSPGEPEPVVMVVDWFAEIRKLRESDLVDSGAYDAYYTRLSEGVRRFVEQRTGVEAMERATFEIRGDLQSAGMADTRILEVEAFLNESDLVKFAKFQPGATRARQDADRVLTLMTQIDGEHPRPEGALESASVS